MVDQASNTTAEYRNSVRSSLVSHENVVEEARPEERLRCEQRVLADTTRLTQS